MAGEWPPGMAIHLMPVQLPVGTGPTSQGLPAPPAALLAGCAVGPDYQRPGYPVPPAFRC